MLINSWKSVNPFAVNFLTNKLTNWPTEGEHKIFSHDDVIKWKHFPRYWPFVRGIHRSTVNSPHKGQWRGALMFTLICARINGWVNIREAGDLRRYRPHHDVIVMLSAEVINAAEMTYDTDTSVLLRNTCIKKWMEIETRIYMYMYVCLHAIKRSVKHTNSLEQYSIIKIHDSNISKQSPFIVIN